MSKNRVKNMWRDEEKGKPAIIFLSIAFAFFLIFVGFFAWHTVRMRSYELDYIRTEGTVVGVESHHSSDSNGGSHTSYYLVISYTYDGHDYKFTDRTGHRYIKTGTIGSSTEIYVNPENPSMAEKVTSADFVSIIAVCFFAFFCATYATGMNILLSIKGSSFRKRLAFVWGAEVLFGILLLFLFWLGLPHSGFGEVFARISGAVGVTVVSGLVLLVTLFDGIITYKLRSYNRETSIQEIEE